MTEITSALALSMEEEVQLRRSQGQLVLGALGLGRVIHALQHPRRPRSAWISCRPPWNDLHHDLQLLLGEFKLQHPHTWLDPQLGGFEQRALGRGQLWLGGGEVPDLWELLVLRASGGKLAQMATERIIEDDQEDQVSDADIIRVMLAQSEAQPGLPAIDVSHASMGLPSRVVAALLCRGWRFHGSGWLWRTDAPLQEARRAIGQAQDSDEDWYLKTLAAWCPDATGPGLMAAARHVARDSDWMSAGMLVSCLVHPGARSALAEIERVALDFDPGSSVSDKANDSLIGDMHELEARLEPGSPQQQAMRRVCKRWARAAVEPSTEGW